MENQKPLGIRLTLLYLYLDIAGSFLGIFGLIKIVSAKEGSISGPLGVLTFIYLGLNIFLSIVASKLILKRKQNAKWVIIAVFGLAILSAISQVIYSMEVADLVDVIIPSVFLGYLVFNKKAIEYFSEK